MRSQSLALILTALCAGSSLVATACSSDGAHSQTEELGTLKMPLTASSTSGEVYRLRNATIKISGTKAATILTEDYIDQTNFELDLPAGQYLIKLNGGWELEKIVDGMPVIVEAFLESDNPMGFVISDQEFTHLNLVFRTGDDVIALGDGRLSVGVIVNDGQGGEADPVACSDGMDNDGDGFVDCEDVDCLSLSDICFDPSIENHPLTCSDGADNDGDGFTDCEDTECQMLPDCAGSEAEDHPAVCTDGLDNDNDGFTDCQDSGCQMLPECNPDPTPENHPAACNDGVDNDQDSFVDCEDVDCQGVDVCAAPENTFDACQDGVDNDLDGDADCADSECSVFAVCAGCPSGLTSCNGQCVNLDNDESNCGGCNFACPAGQLCTAGQCQVSCGAGQTNCSGICVDLSNSEQNCGACGLVCSMGEICNGGACFTP